MLLVTTGHPVKNDLYSIFNMSSAEYIFSSVPVIL